jgi:hypothetical protein
MPLICRCRECKTRLQQAEEAARLCYGCSHLAEDYHYYDGLRAEGYMPFQAKLMAGLADPPDPDDD